MPKKILLISGARPNFMKVSALYRAMCENFTGQLEPHLLHTGQHFSPEMSTGFLKEFSLPMPDVCFELGRLEPALQIAKILEGLVKACSNDRPDLAIVVGDVNSTLACALGARKMNIPVTHVEAGLRSFDPTMPEELNRILTDAASEYLFASEPKAVENLLHEGRSQDEIHLVGNVMIDTLFHQLNMLPPTPSIPGSYAVLTLHRPSNVDSASALACIVEAVIEISRWLPVHFPLHPRTRQSLEGFGLRELLDQGRITIHPPLGYREFLHLWRSAKLVLTDSGGLQEETTALGVPCLTLRDNTERPITLTHGSNRLAGTSKDSILAAFSDFQRNGTHTRSCPKLWDGRAAQRIMEILARVPRTKISQI